VHRFLRVAPVAPGRLVEDLAPRITRPYFDEEAAKERIQRAARELNLFEGLALADDDPRLLDAVASERDAVLPAAWKGDRPKQLDVQRSEFGEIVAADVLSGLFGTRIPASRIAHKETPDQQTRGADVMGWEGTLPELVLVISEVKGSVDSTSPPSVVAGMEEKLTTLQTDRRALLQELIWLRDHSSDACAVESIHACVAFQLRKPVFTTLLAPVLIRPAAVDGADDCGPFEATPDAFGAPIRWITVLVEEDLFKLAAEVYQQARDAT
jgi:hypothetical protein